MRKAFSYFALLALLFGASSCVEEQLNNGENGTGNGSAVGDNAISFVIGGDDALTKAIAGTPVMEPIKLAEDDAELEGLILTETISSLDDGYYPDGVMTKGTPIYTQNFDKLYGEKLYATLFVPVSGSAAFSNSWDASKLTLKTDSEHTYYKNYEQGVRWPDPDCNLYAFLEAPNDFTGSSAITSKTFYQDGKIVIGYKDPVAPSSGVISNSATSQKDILFGSKVISKGTNEIVLYHALTAVKFKVGNVNPLNTSELDPNLTITGVTIKDIYSSGTCTITPSSSKSSVNSVWDTNAYGNSVDYSQSYSKVVTFDKTANTNGFAPSFYNNGTADRNLNADDASLTLFLIPQDVTGKEIVVNFKYNGKDCSRTVKLPENSVWKAGEIHTYTLTVNMIDVDITDSMNDALTVKSNVKYTNTGNVTEYLRAAVEIAWYYGYDEDATIVAAWGGKGTFTNGENTGMNTSDWIEGSDGFYYYKTPVLPGHSASKSLFDTFTAPTTSEEAPFSGAHLEVKALVQGVQFDADKARVTAAWGKWLGEDGIASLSTTAE